MNLPFFRPDRSETASLRDRLIASETRIIFLENQLEWERLRRHHKRLPGSAVAVAETTQRLREGR